jgi:lipoprotein-anchoring transpeptidase ErfK/SrfK
MGRKLQISLLIAAVAAVTGALLLYWWDTTYENRIAEGVTIGGIDVGGLESDEAATQIRTGLVRPLERNVVVRFGGQKFKLEPEEIAIRADIDGMVDEAVDRSREGGILDRTVRRLTGQEVDYSVPPRIAYSERSVEGFVEGVAGNLDREPRNASVEPTASSLTPVDSKNGREVDQARLRKDIERALQDPDDRKVGVEVDKVAPDVTTEELAAQYPTYLVVDRGSFQLHLYENLELSKTYTVAIGAIGFDTPSGLYHIQNKAVDPTWNVPDSDWAGKLAGKTIPPGPDNPLKARWMGIYNGAGIHGTDDVGSLGSAASHGCIRMSVIDVKELYDRVPTGAPIYIA